MDKSQKSNCLPKIRKMVDKIMLKYYNDKFYKKIDLINKVITKCDLDPTKNEKMKIRMMINAWIQKHQDSTKTEKKPDVQKKIDKTDKIDKIDKIPPLPKAIPVSELKPCPPLIDLTIEPEVKKEEVIEIEDDSEQIKTAEEQTAEPQPVPVNPQSTVPLNLFPQQIPNYNPFFYQNYNPYFFNNMEAPCINPGIMPNNGFYQSYNPYTYPYNPYNYN